MVDLWTPLRGERKLQELLVVSYNACGLISIAILLCIAFGPAQNGLSFASGHMMTMHVVSMVIGNDLPTEVIYVAAASDRRR